MSIKTMNIVPDNLEKYLESLEQFPKHIKDFLYERTHDEEVQNIDDFYIDAYQYNFYNYKQKQTALDKIFFFKNGYKTKERNFFTYEYNYYNGSEYMKLKNKIGYDKYYNKVCSVNTNFKQDDKYLYVKPYATDTLDDLVLDPNIISKLVDTMIDYFHKGLWVNNFNNYSIRVDKSSETIYIHDPDIFYILEDNKDLQGILTEEDYLKTLLKYKLSPKSIKYRIKDYLTLESAEYLYYSYWMLENVAQEVQRRMINDY